MLSIQLVEDIVLYKNGKKCNNKRLALFALFHRICFFFIKMEFTESL